ncbi:hypothetical protein [Serratia sp. CY76391]|uniref:hypothetical protein n=1 Tax=Serratia sp. CY76391 TaxID=3383681 RepID=UPI003F9FCBC9
MASLFVFCRCFLVVLGLGIPTYCLAERGNEQLTTEQNRLLAKIVADELALKKMTNACVLVGEGKREQAMDLLKGIDWNGTSVSISKLGVDFDGVIHFYQQHPQLDKESCNRYSAELLHDSSR